MDMDEPDKQWIDMRVEPNREVALTSLVSGQTYRLLWETKAEGLVEVDCEIKQIIPFEGEEIFIVKHDYLPWYVWPFRATGLRARQLRRAQLIGDISKHMLAEKKAWTASYVRNA